MQRNYLSLILSIIVVLLFSLPVSAALPDTISVWEVRPGVGNDAAGGGFASTGTCGTDFSQQNAIQVAFVDLVIGATTTQLTSAGNPIGATMPCNFVNITGGTGCTTGWYELVSQSVGTATMDRSVGTAASTCTGNLGGALLTLTQLDTNMGLSLGAQAHVKATATISTAAAISIDYASGGGSFTTQISGYTTTRGDGGPVTIQASAAANPIININGSVRKLTFRNFVLDCNGASTSGLNIQGNQGNAGENILISACTGVSMTFNNQGHMCIRCTVTGQTGGSTAFLLDQGNGPNTCIDCVAVSSATGGFRGAGFTCIRCIAGNLTGASSDCFSITSDTTGYVLIQSATAYACGRDGFRLNPQAYIVIENSVIWGNTGVGINDVVGVEPAGGYALNWNGYGGNMGGNLVNVSAGANDVTLTSDPTTAGGSNNFALNSTAGGGAALKGVGFPGVLANGGTSIGGTGHIDIGTLQSAGSGGSSGPVGFGFVQ